jgi:hypothetical protein
MCDREMYREFEDEHRPEYQKIVDEFEAEPCYIRNDDSVYNDFEG